MKDKNLPNVFAVPIDKKIENNKNIFMSSKKEERGEKINKNEINKIFNSKNHVYKTRVIITTSSGEKEVDIIGMNSDNLLTLDGQVIAISDIIEIKKV